MTGSEELWKDIPGYEGRYQASTQGRIRSVSRKVPGRSRCGRTFWRTIEGRGLRPGLQKTGHLSVVLGHGRSGSQVHQLVMKTFVGDPPEGMEVLHKNGDPTDNRLENLRYGTRTDNILDVYRQGHKWRKLSTEDVKEIRSLLQEGFTCAEIGKMYDVTLSNISKIKTGGTYSWLS